MNTPIHTLVREARKCHRYAMLCESCKHPVEAAHYYQQVREYMRAARTLKKSLKPFLLG